MIQSFRFFFILRGVMVLIINLANVGLLEQDVSDINNLLSQLSDRKIRYGHLELKKFIRQRKFFMFVAISEEKRIVGMATLSINDVKMLTQNYVKGLIGDVVVDENYRGRGIARSLVESLINVARQYNAAHVSLTSNPGNPKRAAAIRLYERMGFKKIGKLHQSNYYRLQLNPSVNR